ncbi:MAG TPA: hypothetical protein PKH23_07415, partial [Bacillota bacterium]|nr:hypothetical protein [Bacillota bacterium]
YLLGDVSFFGGIIYWAIRNLHPMAHVVYNNCLLRLMRLEIPLVREESPNDRYHDLGNKNCQKGERRRDTFHKQKCNDIHETIREKSRQDLTVDNLRRSACLEMQNHVFYSLSLHYHFIN